MSKISQTNIEDMGATLSNNHNQNKSEWAVSGQNLLTGEVVYLSSSGWIPNLTSAQIFEDETEVASMIEVIQLRDRFVLFPDKISISHSADGVPQPNHFRETFRATGPSNRFHGKQADYYELHHV